jgi:hypothetical protein
VNASVPEIPWKAPFARYLEYVDDIHNLVELTRAGMRRVQMMPDLLAILYNDQELDDNRRSQRESESRLAELAANEEQRGYPLLYAHSVVSLWGSLEVLVQDLAAAWLSTHSQALTEPPLSAIKLPVGTLRSFRDDDLMVYVVSEASRTLKSDLKLGVGQFESVLDAVGLGGGVDQRVRDGVFYLQQYRHLLVHRGGVADRRFIDNCPALAYCVGETVRVPAALYLDLWLASQMYAATLRNRCNAADGLTVQNVDPPPGFGDFAKSAKANDEAPVL